MNIWEEGRFDFSDVRKLVRLKQEKKAGLLTRKKNWIPFLMSACRYWLNFSPTWKRRSHMRC